MAAIAPFPLLRSFHRTVSRPSSRERCANLSDKTADGPLANPLGGRQRREGGRMKEGAGEEGRKEKEREREREISGRAIDWGDALPDPDPDPDPG